MKFHAKPEGKRLCKVNLKVKAISKKDDSGLIIFFCGSLTPGEGGLTIMAFTGRYKGI